jgi:hypothetical protein
MTDDYISFTESDSDSAEDLTPNKSNRSVFNTNNENSKYYKNDENSKYYEHNGLDYHNNVHNNVYDNVHDNVNKHGKNYSGLEQIQRLGVLKNKKSHYFKDIDRVYLSRTLYEAILYPEKAKGFKFPAPFQTCILYI